MLGDRLGSQGLHSRSQGDLEGGGEQLLPRLFK